MSNVTQLNLDLRQDSTDNKETSTSAPRKTPQGQLELNNRAPIVQQGPQGIIVRGLTTEEMENIKKWLALV